MSWKVDAFLRENLCGVVINLDNSPKRYKHFCKNASDLPFLVSRISAQDGEMISEEFQSKIVDSVAYGAFYGGKFPGSGTIGCYLSHRMAWEKMVHTSIPWMIIFEDDVSFCSKTLTEVLYGFLTHYGNCIDLCSFALRGSGMPLPLGSIDEYRLCTYGRDIYCAGAYILNLKSAKCLLEDSLPMKFQLDDYYTQCWRWGVVFAGVEPRIVYHRDEELSDIKARGRRQFRKTQYISKVLQKCVYAVLAFWSIIFREMYNIRRLLWAIKQYIIFHFRNL